jgi:hypothetical protein
MTYIRRESENSGWEKLMRKEHEPEQDDYMRSWMYLSHYVSRQKQK